MLRTTQKKLDPHKTCDSLLLPMSEFDRDCLDCRNVPGVVLEVDPKGLYQIGTKYGIVNTNYSRNQLLKGDCVLVEQRPS